MWSKKREPVRNQIDYMSRIGDMVHANARRYPDKDSIKFMGKSYTWRETNQRINSVGHALLDLGLNREDRVGVLSENTGQYLEIPFATSKVALIFTPLNFRLGHEELITIINGSGVRAIIVGSKYVETINKIRDRIPMVEYLIGMADATGGNHGLDRDYDDLATSFDTSEPKVEVDENDAYLLMYSGGTTGLPKGAVYKHRTAFAWLLNCAIIDQATPDDVYMVSPPIFHLGVQFPYLPYWYLGCTTVVMEKFDAVKLLETVEKNKITVTMWMGTMLNLLRAVPDYEKYDMSSLRMIQYGAAPISAETLEWAQGFLKCGFHQIADGTEAGMSVADLWPLDHTLGQSDKGSKRLSSGGREAPNVWMRVVDEEGNDMPCGQVGEIVSRSINTMEEWWNNPEATKETFRQGWLHMGDMGYIDEEGYLYIVDRLKDMIISGGENIFSQEIERTINSHPAVIESAIIGVPDKLWGEVVHAVIVLDQGYEPKPTGDEIINFCKENLASYKKPKSIEFVDELPRSAMGKVLKITLREKAWQGYEKKIG